MRMLRIEDIEETRTQQQNHDERLDADASAAPEVPRGDVVRSNGIPVFRDCRGQLVWLD